MTHHVDPVRVNASSLDHFVAPRRRRPHRSTMLVCNSVVAAGDDDVGIEISQSRRLVFLDRSRSFGGTNHVLEADGIIYVMTARTHDELTRRLEMMERLRRRFESGDLDRKAVAVAIMCDGGLRDLAVSADCACGDLVAWRRCHGSFAAWLAKRFASSRQPRL